MHNTFKKTLDLKVLKAPGKVSCIQKRGAGRGMTSVINN
jgi:hypothetical protein